MDKETINMKTPLLKMFLEIMHKYCAKQSRTFLKVERILTGHS